MCSKTDHLFQNWFYLKAEMVTISDLIETSNTAPGGTTTCHNWIDVLYQAPLHFNLWNTNRIEYIFRFQIYPIHQFLGI